MFAPPCTQAGSTLRQIIVCLLTGFGMRSRAFMLAQCLLPSVADFGVMSTSSGAAVTTRDRSRRRSRDRSRSRTRRRRSRNRIRTCTRRRIRHRSRVRAGVVVLIEIVLERNPCNRWRPSLTVLVCEASTACFSPEQKRKGSARLLALSSSLMFLSDTQAVALLS